MVTSSDDQGRIQLVAEQLDVAKSEVITDRVRVKTTVEEREVSVEYVQERGDLKVERVPVDREVQAVPEPRQEGDTFIVSLVEERLVVEKRLFVIEELHITRMSTSEVVTAPMTLRTMHASVDRSADNMITGRE